MRKSALRRLLVLPVVLLALSVAAARAEVVARVNGEEINRSEFGRALVQSLGKGTLDSLIDRVLLRQAARRRDLEVTPGELRKRRELELRLRMRAVFRNARMSRDQFADAAQNYGWDMEQLREELRRDISETTLRLKLLAQKLLEDQIRITEEELKAYHERTREPRYAAAHIEVAERHRAEQLLELLRREPENWSAAVVRYSLDRASTPHKGRLPLVPAESELGRVLAEMEPGGLTLHKMDDRWHVLRFLELVPAEQSFEEAREELRAELLALRATRQHHRLLAALHAGAAVVPNLWSAPEARAVLGDDVAAYVNGEPVLVDELADALIEQFGAAMLDSYIERVLVLQEAEGRGLSVGKEELERRMDAVAEQIFHERAGRRGISGEDLRERLAERGVGLAEYKEMLAREFVSEKDVRATLLAEKMVADQIEVTEEEARRAYREYYGERWLVREIVAEDAAEAQRFYEQLARGADFSMLVRLESDRPGAWMPRGNAQIVTSSHPYYSYVKEIEEGGISGVFKHGGQYRIIKVVRHRPPSEGPPFESVREEMRRQAFLQKAQERIRAFLIKLKAEADIQLQIA